MSKKGENIFKRKDGRWEARYIHHYENGKAKYRSIYATTYSKAKAKRIEEMKNIDTILDNLNSESITLKELSYMWLSNVKISVKESTYTRYYRVINKYILPFFGDTKLKYIESKNVYEFPEKLLNSGGLNKGTLSPKTVTDIISILKSVFKYGKENGYVCPDISKLKYPSKTKKPISILSTNEQIKIENILFNSDEPICLGILFTLFTGIRIGELCGLKWEDINFENETVIIKRTIERISNLNQSSVNKTKIVICEPKTENSFRIIPLPKFLVEYLYLRKKDNNFYIVTGNENYTEPHCVYIKYQKFLKDNNIAPHTFHSLRHTFATRCVELGFDIKSLSEILGHSNINTTLSIYVHPTLNQKKSQMEKLKPLNN